jgi:hypothetical protein
LISAILLSPFFTELRTPGRISNTLPGQRIQSSGNHYGLFIGTFSGAIPEGPDSFNPVVVIEGGCGAYPDTPGISLPGIAGITKVADEGLIGCIRIEPDGLSTAGLLT